MQPPPPAAAPTPDSSPVRRRRLRLSRRGALGLGGGALAALIGVRFALPRWLRPGPVRTLDELSPAARQLAAAAFEGIVRERIWDVHVHAVGLGTGGTGCWVNPDMRSHLHPIQKLQFDLYLAASGVTDPDAADAQYVDRLLALHRAFNPAGKLLLLAFDYHRDAAGAIVRELSPFHTPDDYVLGLAARHDDVRAVASIHPYRPDALDALDQAHDRGAVAIKWLPNAMGIDPASAQCDRFYARLADLHLPLLTHAGLEKAVHAEEAQELGNPLRLRRALEAGCRVIVAHCASLGTGADLDHPSNRSDATRPPVPCFDLFLRLMAEERYRGLLFADISALTLVNRSGRPLLEMLRRTDLHDRLVNGSDYPLVAIDPVINLRLLVKKGVLDGSERSALRELFEANPLLFDFVLKRRLRVMTEGEGKGKGFAPQIFESMVQLN